MSAPSAGIGKAKATGVIETLGIRISCIYQQTYAGHVHILSTLGSSLNELGGNALLAIFWQYGKAIEVELSCLCFIIHASMVTIQPYLS